MRFVKYMANQKLNHKGIEKMLDLFVVWLRGGNKKATISIMAFLYIRVN